MWRPLPCRWFELVTTRDHLAPVLHALARSGAVELQTLAHEGRALATEGTAELLARYRDLARDWRAHWPPPQPPASLRVDDPRRALALGIDRLEAWRDAAAPRVAERERLLARLRLLDDWHRLLQCPGPWQSDPSWLVPPAEPLVSRRLAVLADAARALAGYDGLHRVIAAGPEDFVLAVGSARDLAAFDARVAAARGRRLDWPPELAPRAGAVAAEQQRLRSALAELATRLDALERAHELAATVGCIEGVAWLLEQGAELAASEHLVWITGWTPFDDQAALTAPLVRDALPGVAAFAAPPEAVEPPTRLVNPRWLRAFETFASMLGQPGRHEADPSPALAVITPLLFGFMFGDVGHGAVLMVAGWTLRRRVPALALLVPGGAMAIGFGLLFGSVFAREDLLPALWLHPLAHPVEVLAVSLAIGASILLAGLGLQALQAHWAGGLADWLRRDAALPAAYVGALASLRWPAAAWALALGALWHAAGRVAAGAQGRDGGAAAGRLRIRRVAGAFAAGLFGFVEHALQLAVNTVSFARVGAFALAHAGVSAAVVGVADAIGPVAGVVVLVLGNVLILLLEGLVVGIQTTRLVLFEFFVRFLRGAGRPFRPLVPPLTRPFPSLASETAA